MTGGASCPVSAALHSSVAAHFSKYHCYNKKKKHPSRFSEDLDYLT